VEDTTERNNQILSMHKAGETLAVIGRQFGISTTRAMQIIKKMKAKEVSGEVAGYLGDDEPIERLGLNTRSFNSFTRAGIETVGQLRKIAENDESLLGIRNIGPLQIENLRQKLKEHGR
jgi:DNA-directed RNA polymerase alpha subunit